MNCVSCHKAFSKNYTLEAGPWPGAHICYDCARKRGDPRVIAKKVEKRKCDMCLKSHPLHHLHNFKGEALCPDCLGKFRSVKRSAQTSSSSASLGKLARQNQLLELERNNLLLKRSASHGRPLLRDQIKAEVHNRQDILAKAGPFTSISALQAGQRGMSMAKSVNANTIAAVIAKARGFSSFAALQYGQRARKAADGFSGDPGNADAGADAVAINSRTRPQSYGGVDSRRDDSFVGILPGGPMNDDPAFDPYPNSAGIGPNWVPDGEAIPMDIEAARQRDQAFRPHADAGRSPSQITTPQLNRASRWWSIESGASPHSRRSRTPSVPDGNPALKRRS